MKIRCRLGDVDPRHDASFCTTLAQNHSDFCRFRFFDAALNLRVVGSIPTRLTSIPPSCCNDLRANDRARAPELNRGPSLHLRSNLDGTACAPAPSPAISEGLRLISGSGPRTLAAQSSNRRVSLRRASEPLPQTAALLFCSRRAERADLTNHVGLVRQEHI